MRQTGDLFDFIIWSSISNHYVYLSCVSWNYANMAFINIHRWLLLTRSITKMWGHLNKKYSFAHYYRIDLEACARENLPRLKVGKYCVTVSRSNCHVVNCPIIWRQLGKNDAIGWCQFMQNCFKLIQNYASVI